MIHFSFDQNINNHSKKRNFALLYGRFMLFFMIACVLAGGFRVHFTGLGRTDPEKVSALRKSDAIEGFIYKTVWNKDDRMLFVNSTFKAIADVTGLDEETKLSLASGAFVKLTHFYISEPDPPRNPGIFNYRRYLLSRGVSYSIKIYEDGIEKIAIDRENAFPGIIHLPGAAVRSLAGRKLKELLGEDSGVLTTAIMTGDTGALDDETKENFRNGGVSHLLAVSGMHVAFVLLPLKAVVRNRKTGFKARRLLLLLPTFVFMAIADFSSSVLRAGLGAIFSMVSDVLERPYDRFNALCFSAGVQILINPYVVFNTGFILSYASVIALIFVAPGVEELFTSMKYRERRGVKKISAVNKSALCAGISVNIALMPLSAYMFGSISPAGLVTTLYASPLSAFVCIGGYVLFLLALADPVFVLRPLKWLLKYVMKLVCRLVAVIAAAGSRLPETIGRISTGRPPVWLILIIYAAVILTLTPFRRTALEIVKKTACSLKKSRAARFAAALTVIAVIVLGVNAMIERPMIEALVIDVGQGSSMLVKAGGYTGLVDTGTGQTDIVEVVRAQGVKKLDYIVISHGHSDHTGGLESVLSDFPPAVVYVSADNSPSLLGVRQAASEAGWKVLETSDGDRVKLGGVTMSFLSSDVFFGGSSDADENNSSLCVMYSCRAGSMIAAGDLQKEGEDELAEKGAFSDVDVMIVPHHGSASGSSAKMLSRTLPEYAIISVGRNNSYGHPSKEAIGRLTGCGAEVFRTDTGGGICFSIGRIGLFRKERVRVWQTL